MVTRTIEMSFWSRVQGPISSGRIHQHVADYEADVAEALGDEAQDEWLYNLNSRIRHQTPYYTTQIDIRRLAWNRYQVHDSDVLYGPWLESGDYTPRTRFTGYFSREDAEAAMERKRRNIGRRILKQHRARGRLI